MKWYKQYTNAHKSEWCQDLFNEFGKVEGYGLYALFISYFADKWNGKSKPIFRVRSKDLQNFMEISPQKLRKFARITSDSSRVHAESTSDSKNLVIKFEGNFVEVYFPKLLKIRDEHSRKSGVIPDEDPESRAQEEEEELEKEKNRIVVVVGKTAATEPDESLFDPSKKRGVTGNKTPQGEEKKPATPPTEKSFIVIDSLKGNRLREEVLSTISTTTQQQWIKKYDSKWLVTSIDQAIEYHITASNALTAAQINDWGIRLVGWLRREKNAVLANPGILSGISAHDLAKQKAEAREECKFIMGSDYTDQAFEQHWEKLSNKGGA